MKLNRIIEEKRRQMEKAKKMETAKNLAVGTAIGTALGAAAGILLAPKAGKETREDISKKSKEVADTVLLTVDEKFEATKEWTEKVKNDVKSNLEEMKDKKKNKVNDVMDDVNNVVEDVGIGMASVAEIIEETSKEIKDDLTN